MVSVVDVLQAGVPMQIPNHQCGPFCTFYASLMVANDHDPCRSTQSTHPLMKESLEHIRTIRSYWVGVLLTR